MKADIQLQVPGEYFKRPSVTLVRGGATVLIPISKKLMEEIRKKLRPPEEG